MQRGREKSEKRIRMAWNGGGRGEVEDGAQAIGNSSPYCTGQEYGVMRTENAVKSSVEPWRRYNRVHRLK